MRRNQSAANASSTLPGIPPNREYREFTNSMPPVTTAPGPSIEPPLALTPFVVWNSRWVSKSQTTVPSSAR
jgi:hypothetical protein